MPNFSFAIFFVRRLRRVWSSPRGVGVVSCGQCMRPAGSSCGSGGAAEEPFVASTGAVFSGSSSFPPGVHKCTERTARKSGPQEDRFNDFPFLSYPPESSRFQHSCVGWPRARCGCLSVLGRCCPIALGAQRCSLILRHFLARRHKWRMPPYNTRQKNSANRQRGPKTWGFSAMVHT